LSVQRDIVAVSPHRPRRRNAALAADSW